MEQREDRGSLWLQGVRTAASFVFLSLCLQGCPCFVWSGHKAEGMTKTALQSLLMGYVCNLLDEFHNVSDKNLNIKGPKNENWERPTPLRDEWFWRASETAVWKNEWKTKVNCTLFQESFQSLCFFKMSYHFISATTCCQRKKQPSLQTALKINPPTEALMMMDRETSWFIQISAKSVFLVYPPYFTATVKTIIILVLSHDKL